MLNVDQQKKLLQIAREAVKTYIKTGKIADFQNKEEALNQELGVFVTLRLGKKLRGCIGQIEPKEKPLWQAVRDMAIEAATDDPRFYSVDQAELEKLNYEISVLSILEKISDWRKIELGKHGVIVRQGSQGGVFLPQVADETGWSLEEFLKNLCVSKAGLEEDCYQTGKADLYVFTVQAFSDDLA